MQPPFFSIVTASFNRAAMLPAAIRSVLDQEYQNWELIIVDDGSTDNTAEVVARFTDPRIRYIHQENRERSAARNTGIQAAKGLYICFLDSDDYYLPNHLSSLHSTIQEKNQPVALLYTGAKRQSPGGSFSEHPIYHGTEHPVRFIFFRHLLMNSVCIHRDILQKHTFNENMNVWEDINLYVRITHAYPFIQVPVYTTVAVTHPGSNAYTLFQRSDTGTLKQYLNNIQDVFVNHHAGRYISDSERKKEIGDKILAIAQGAAWKPDASAYTECVILLFKYHPARLLSAEFMEITKELMIYLLKSRRKAS